jgi:uroporphyrinogen-III synthase
MRIKKILVSQPKPENGKSPYYELAEKNNIHIDFRQFTQIEGISAKDFRQSRIDILSHSAIIFNSKTAIDHFFRICEEMRIGVPDTMKYFCISESTAFYLQKYIVYRKRKIFYGNGKIDDLMELITKYNEGNFLVPLSDKHADDLPKALDKYKIRYNIAILYKTVCCDLSDLSNLDYDILVFFSPSGIKSLFKNYPEFKQNNTKIASFGDSTAKAVKEAGLKLDIEAPTPEAPSMTMALDVFIREFNKNNK